MRAPSQIERPIHETTYPEYRPAESTIIRIRPLKDLEAALSAGQQLFQRLFEGCADALDLFAAHSAEERKGEGAGGDVLADGEIAGVVAELLDHVRLEVDGGKVVVTADALFAEHVHDGVAV